VTTVFSSVEDDFYGWLIDQAAALKGQGYDSVDWTTLSKELQSAGRSLDQRLENDLEVLLTHLLRWHHQPDYRGGAWQASIQNARSSIADRLEGSPWLTQKLIKLTNRAYRKARRSAGAAMNLTEHQWEEKFAHSCPWDPQRFVRADFWPESENQTQAAGHAEVTPRFRGTATPRS
jgi:uncharacterized protein DUF29